LKEGKNYDLPIKMEATPVSDPPALYKRLFIYAKEMFPVWVYLPYVLALYICMNITVQAAGGQPIQIGDYAVVGMVSAFFFMLQMRAFDDLKDFEIDKELFPWRATPKGLVLKKDLHLLAWTSFGILILTNILFGQRTLFFFGLTMLYTLLTYKWFFAEEYHRKHLFFTMLTHQPLPWMINFFLIHTALAAQDPKVSFEPVHWIILFVFSLPVTAWEVSRKIRAVGHETHYETFSLLLGTRFATLIPLTALMLMGGFSLYLGYILGLGTLFAAIVWGMMALALIGYSRFLIWPTPPNNILTPVAMGFSALLFLNLLVHMLVRYDIQFF